MDFSNLKTSQRATVLVTKRQMPYGEIKFGRVSMLTDGGARVLNFKLDPEHKNAERAKLEAELLAAIPDEGETAIIEYRDGEFTNEAGERIAYARLLKVNTNRPAARSAA